MNVVHENVLVKVEKAPTEKNGIQLPESDIVKERKGVVVRFGEAVPSGVQTLLGAKPTVIYKEYFDGEAITEGEESFIVMNFKDILMIL